MMENNFREIETENEEKVHERIKRQTMDRILRLKVVYNIIDLFTVKAGGTFSQAFMPEQDGPKK